MGTESPMFLPEGQIRRSNLHSSQKPCLTLEDVFLCIFCTSPVSHHKDFQGHPMVVVKSECSQGSCELTTSDCCVCLDKENLPKGCVCFATLPTMSHCLCIYLIGSFLRGSTPARVGDSLKPPPTLLSFSCFSPLAPRGAKLEHFARQICRSLGVGHPD